MKARYAFMLALALTLCGCAGKKAVQEEEIPEPEIPPIGFIADGMVADTTEVRTGEAFTSFFNRLGLGADKCYDLVQKCDTVFDVRSLRAGNKVVAYYTPDSLRQLQYAVYINDRIRSTVFKLKDSTEVWVYEKPVVKERKYTDVVIKSSLWNDMIEADASPALIMDLADIYQWSVNLFALQEDDRFQVIYTQSVCDGEVVKIDTVHFSMFSRDGKTVPAVRYTIPGEKHASYWGKDGESLKRMFLKAPLKYNRISSRFSYHRKHPVTGRVKPHTAVDYAAPTGTPVHAIGDGKVTLCGWDGTGGGNRIRIKHSQGYESCYMHLSRFAKGIRAGSTVSQGQLIGYVGATGTATGPHLDFRIWHNGKPIDPLSINSPNTEPLAKQYLPEFNTIYDAYMAELDTMMVFKARQDSIKAVNDSLAIVQARADSLAAVQDSLARHHRRGRKK